MSKKRGNKKGKNADDDFEDNLSVDNDVNNVNTKSSKTKPSKKGKKGKKDDDWSDNETIDPSKNLFIYLLYKSNHKLFQKLFQKVKKQKTSLNLRQRRKVVRRVCFRNHMLLITYHVHLHFTF